MHPLETILLAATMASASVKPTTRAFQFTYETTIGPLDAGTDAVTIFIPLASSDDYQTIKDRVIEASVLGEVGREPAFGNEFWQARIEKPEGQSVHVVVRYEVERHPFATALATSPVEALSAEQRSTHARFLTANARMPVGHPILEPTIAEIRGLADSTDLRVLARTTYDWVVNNMEYKKVGTGWGNGDTYWACSKRYGNCTDFHALFNSLALSFGIPARFEIGFPVPEDRGQGELGGYHCWTRFYLPGSGWLPIDASEAKKNLARRDEFYARQPADRIHLTTGRDLVLSPEQTSGPLNFFIYPHVERGGQRWPGAIVNRFRYEDRAPSSAASDAATH